MGTERCSTLRFREKWIASSFPESGNIYNIHSKHLTDQKKEKVSLKELTGRNFEDFFITANALPRQLDRCN